MTYSTLGKRTSRRAALTTMGAGVATLLVSTRRAAAQGQMAPLTAEEKANIQVVNAFIDAWNAKDGAKVMSFFADDARFAVGQIGKTPAFDKPNFAGLIKSATSIKMTITPGTTWARGPVVTHERTDDIVTPQRKIGGKYIAVFTLRRGKIVDFIDFTFGGAGE